MSWWAELIVMLPVNLVLVGFKAWKAMCLFYLSFLCLTCYQLCRLQLWMKDSVLYLGGTKVTWYHSFGGEGCVWHHTRGNCSLSLSLSLHISHTCALAHTYILTFSVSCLAVFQGLPGLFDEFLQEISINSSLSNSIAPNFSFTDQCDFFRHLGGNFFFVFRI